MLFALLLLTFLQIACRNPDSGPPPPPLPNYDFPYDINKPELELKLHRDLEEISGLSMGFSPQQILAIQDEDGKVFFLPRDSEEVDKDVKFWKDGDYEGVEAVGEDIFVVKSSGTLYRFREDIEDDEETDKFNDFLKPSNDVEGLGYDPAGNRLLLACKGHAGKGDDFKFKRAVYAFNLDDFRFDEEPVYLISLEDVQHYLQTSSTERTLQEAIDFFGFEDMEMVFAPSAIAVHPQSGDHYLTSSVGNLLMVVSPEGKILHLEKMKNKVHPQPEGICFAPDGTLYISNEGRGGRGTILKFTPQ